MYSILNFLIDHIFTEFVKAIHESSVASSNNFSMDRLVQCLWWCAEHMFSGTMRMIDLATE